MAPKSKKKNKGTKQPLETSLDHVRDEIARSASIMKKLKKTLKNLSK